jgi:hypothetical protein
MRPLRGGRQLLIATSALSLLAVSPAFASSSKAPTVHLEMFASAPAGATNPDDITRLHGLIYVTYQNNAAADGTPAGSKSTIVAFNSRGQVVATYELPGRCDGLTADRQRGEILATVNEDNNSSFFTIRPGSGSAGVTHYTYTPDPAQKGSDGTNGGTDSIAVTPDGTIYVAHSNPDVSLPAPNNTAAEYVVNLHGSTATLTRAFGVNDQARVINPAAGGPASAPMALTDPDSNTFVPGDGTLIQDAQADSKLVLATHLGSGHPDLRVLHLTNASLPAGVHATPQLDDVRPVTGPGTLYVVDQKTGDIYRTDTSAVVPGTVFVSQPAPKSGDLPNTPALGVVDLRTGVVTHVVNSLGSPKGLMFVSRGDDEAAD